MLQFLTEAYLSHRRKQLQVLVTRAVLLGYNLNSKIPSTQGATYERVQRPEVTCSKFQRITSE